MNHVATHEEVASYPTNESRHTHERVTSHTRTSYITHTQGHMYTIVPKKKTATSHVTHTNESCHTHERVMPHTRTSHVAHMN